MEELKELKKLISMQDRQIGMLEKTIEKLEIKQLIHERSLKDNDKNLWEIRRITNRTYYLLLSFVILVLLFWISTI